MTKEADGYVLSPEMLKINKLLERSRALAKQSDEASAGFDRALGELIENVEKLTELALRRSSALLKKAKS